MPHLIVEYSSNLPAFPQSHILKELNRSLTESPDIPVEADLKTRLVVTEHFAIGTADTPRAFVHAELRLLSGRSAEAKRELSQRIANVLHRMTPQPAGTLLQLSVEVVDMDRDSYSKVHIAPST